MTRILLLAIIVTAGCQTTVRNIGQPVLDVRTEPVSLTKRDKVDILFMVDNSPSMAPKQAALRARIVDLVAKIQSLATQGIPASFHIGVVTSDLGAGSTTLNQGQCHPGGDGARLQTRPAANTNAPAGCANFALTNGDSYIDFDSATGTGNFGAADLPLAISCIASVGEAGCGFESPLESVYQVLTTPTLNPGFVRDDALLVVAWLTDEDDCSAPPDSDLFDPSTSGVQSYGTLHSFRCTQFGISCNGRPVGSGDSTLLANCAPTPMSAGGKLYDVSRYTALLAADRIHGGLKDDPADVLLVSIAAPSTPFATVTSSPCVDQLNTASCTTLAHSCSDAVDPHFFGDPAVRMHAVLQAASNRVEASICDTDYAAAVARLGDSMGSRMAAGCLPGSLGDVAEPNCSVTMDGAVVTRCGDGHLPCWEVLDDAGCPPRLTPSGTTQQLRLRVEGQKPGATLVASCPLYVPTL